MIEREQERVLRLVRQTHGIRWWIDRQIERGKTDEEIEAELPLAVAFITGRVGVDDLLRARNTTGGV